MNKKIWLAVWVFMAFGLIAEWSGTSSNQGWVLGNVLLGCVPCYLLHLTVRLER